MDLKAIDPQIWEYNNIWIISAALMITITERLEESMIIPISENIVSSIEIHYHIKNPTIF